MTKPTNILNGKLTLTAYGAANEVGRSAFIIEDGKRAILLDAGIKIQPKRAPSLSPQGLDGRVKDLTAIILSHAHVDHSGYIPALFEKGYSGKLYMTHPTKDIVRLLWEDQMKIDARHWGEDGLEEAWDNTEVRKYREVFEVAEGITVEFYNSGHILGAAMVLINWEGTTILYTGDMNDQQTPMFDGFEIPDVEVDVLLTETTNGCRKVKPRAEVNEEFLKEVMKTLNAGHRVTIPSFAVGRSQELLIILTEAIKNYPIYIDGMINKMIAITERFLNSDWVDTPLLDRLKKEGSYSPFRYKNITPITPDNLGNTHEYRRFLGKSKEPSIIVTTSGMMEPSPLHTHLMFTAHNKNNLIAVTGYQAEGTTGREIMEGKRTVKLSTSRNKFKDVEIKSRIMRFGFSGHTSSEGIADLIEAVKPKQIYLIHGDPVNQNELKERITNGVIPKALNHLEKFVLN